MAEKLTTLVAASDAHFAWLLGELTNVDPPGIVLPPNGLDTAEVITMLRGIAASVRAVVDESAWLIVSGTDVVGLISLMRAPDADGVTEIGYGIAASQRGRGHATRAVQALVALARGIGLIAVLAAETSVTNEASQLVLRRAGFVQCHERVDAEDGPMIGWTLSLN